MVTSARSSSDLGANFGILIKTETRLKDPMPSKIGSLLYAIQGYFVSLVLQIRHQTQDAIIRSLVGLVEMHDPVTGKHLERTQHFVKALVRKLQDRPNFKDVLTQKIIHSIYMSAPLHDIGKLRVRDAVLLKPGKLTAEEFDEMKKHAAYGGTVLDQAIERLGYSSFLAVARDIACYHHEKWDGTGYPVGLEGDAIPFPARIMAVADVYDALTSKRPYKEPWPHERARDLIVNERGKHFDPVVVDVFIDVQNEFRKVAQDLCDANV